MQRMVIKFKPVEYGKRWFLSSYKFSFERQVKNVIKYFQLIPFFITTVRAAKFPPKSSKRSWRDVLNYAKTYQVLCKLSFALTNLNAENTNIFNPRLRQSINLCNCLKSLELCISRNLQFFKICLLPVAFMVAPMLMKRIAALSLKSSHNAGPFCVLFTWLHELTNP